MGILHIKFHNYPPKDSGAERSKVPLNLNSGNKNSGFMFYCMRHIRA